jgi:hypothetical protein
VKCCAGTVLFLIQNQLTSIDINGFNQLARRVAEVSRFKDFKDCDVIGSKGRFAYRSCSRLPCFFQDFSPLVATLPTTTFSPLVNSSQLLSTRVDSPHLSSTCPIFSQPVVIYTKEKLLHRETVTQSKLYTEQGLHREAFTQRQLLHKASF